MKLNKSAEKSGVVELVVISDIHAHPWSAFASGSGATNSRLQQTLSVVRASLAEAKQRDGLWLCAGDLVDTAGLMRNVVANEVIAVLNEFPSVRKIIIFGNHDSRGRGATPVSPNETATAAVVDAVENMTLLHQGTLQTEEGLTIYGEGAQPRAEHYKFLEKKEEYTGWVGLFHMIVDGTPSPSGHKLSGKVSADELLGRFSLSIVGDVHHPTHWEEDGRAVLVPGSPEHHNFGDKGDRGYWIVPMQEEGHGQWTPNIDQIRLVPSDSPKFLTVETPDEVKDDGNYYRIKGGNVDQDSLPENAKAVGSPPTTVESRSVLEGASSRQEVLERWIKETPPDLEVSDEELIQRGLDVLPASGAIQMKPAEIVNVHAENFFSYEEFQWDLDAGVHLIVGQSVDFDSNGAGKSTLIEAIYWALFGKTTKGVSAGDEIRWGADSCRVSVAMMAGGEPCLIKRRRTPSGPDLEITIDGDPVGGSSAREVQQNFMSWLGVSEDIVRGLSYFSQEDVFLISRLTDAERKTLLSDLCGLDMYDDAARVASSHASEAEQIVQKNRDAAEREQNREQRLQKKYESRTEKFEEFNAARERRLQDMEEELDALEASDQTEELRTRLEALEVRSEDLLETWRERRATEAADRAVKEVQERREELQESKERINDAVATLKEQLEEAPDPDEDSLRATEEALSTAENKVDNVEFTMHRREADLERLQKEFKKTRKLEPGSTCPRCKQEVGQAHIDDMRYDLQNDISALQEEIEELHEFVDVAKEERTEVREDLKSLREASQWLDKLEDLEERQEELDSAEERLHELVDEKESRLAAEWYSYDEDRIENWMSRARSYVQDWVDIHEDKRQDLKDEMQSLREKDNPHKEALDELSDELKACREERTRLEEKSEEALSSQRAWAYWAEGFSKQGIQSLLLEEVATLFNEYRGRVFPLLTRGKYDVQFSTRSETQAGEVRERTEFVVRDEGAKVPYDNLSGGQRRRVDLGVMLTLAMANAEMRGVPGVLGLLALDECADHLDAEGMEALAETLRVEVSEVIPKIYVVSQDTEMKSLFPSVVEVAQDEEGISHLNPGGEDV